MNLLDIKTRVKRLFGDESGAQIIDADIIRWANDGQLDIVRRTECLQAHVETNSVAKDNSYALPPDAIRVRRVTYDGNVLSRVELEELDGVNKSREASDITGTPTQYYIWGRQLWLYPTPSNSGTGNLDIYYLKAPATLGGDADVPDIPGHMHEDIVRYCLARAKELDEEFNQAEQIWNDYQMRTMLSFDEQHNPNADSYPAVRALPGDEW